jgi:hypothetical protein
MAHFAKLGLDNIVQRIDAVNNNVLLDENGVEQEQKGIDFLKNLFNEPDAKWVQTSYNNNFRKKYACIGFTYDSTIDAFIPNKRFPSFVWDETIWDWKAPIEYPNTTTEINGVITPDLYTWDESQLNWVKVML